MQLAIGLICGALLGLAARPLLDAWVFWLTISRVQREEHARREPPRIRQDHRWPT